MNVVLEPGKYVVAVSGGVDSVALLHALAELPDVELVIAHYDHGIREDSDQDRWLVEDLAAKHHLAFMTEQGRLGANASEATARDARYDFLQRTQRQSGARAIITAHHQDDLLETAILNILRGTGRRGLTSLQSGNDIVRPLLHMPKADILTYATKQNLSWREDSTNYDERYKRNYIRHKLLVRFDTNARQRLLTILGQLQVTNQELDQLLNRYVQGDELDKKWFITLPHTVAKEVMATWLRSNNLADFDRKTLERLTIAAKTKPTGKRLEVLRGYQIVVKSGHLALELVER